MTPEQIYNAAVAAGLKAASTEDDTFRFNCGFAWVIVKPARGKFVTWCKANKHGRSGYEPGWHFWYSEFSSATQSMDVHVAAAEAFAKVLNDNGIVATVGSRLD